MEMLIKAFVTGTADCCHSLVVGPPGWAAPRLRRMGDAGETRLSNKACGAHYLGSETPSFVIPQNACHFHVQLLPYYL